MSGMTDKAMTSVERALAGLGVPVSRFGFRESLMRAPPPTLSITRTLFGFPPRTHWVELKPACPVSRSHRVEMWLSPGKCPRCGSHLERDVMPYRIWD